MGTKSAPVPWRSGPRKKRLKSKGKGVSMQTKLFQGEMMDMSEENDQEEIEIDQRCPHCRALITDDEFVNAATYDDEKGGGMICPHCETGIPIDYYWAK